MKLKESIVSVPWPPGDTLRLYVYTQSSSVCAHLAVSQKQAECHKQKFSCLSAEVKKCESQRGNPLPLPIVPCHSHACHVFSLSQGTLWRHLDFREGLLSAADHSLPGFLAASVWLCLLEELCSLGPSSMTEVDKAT